ncbi:MAG: hypothetical protein QW331_00100 [Candidatus Woesearchaeota archaeon]
MKRQLLRGFFDHTFESIKLLSSEERRMHYSFLMLAGLYQLRELIGIKERT